MFDRSGDHSPPSVWHLFPDSAGRSVRLFRFAFRLGQRGVAPLCARPLDEARRQFESSDGHVLQAVGASAASASPPSITLEARGRPAPASSGPCPFRVW